jgi:hypothetical protein
MMSKRQYDLSLVLTTFIQNPYVKKRIHFQI